MAANTSRTSAPRLSAEAQALVARARQLTSRPDDARLSALAIPLLRRAIESDPHFLLLRTELARIQQRQGLLDDARSSIRGARELAPQSIGLQLHECMLEIPNFYEDDPAIEVSRGSYRERLQSLLARVRSADRNTLAAAAPMVGYATPFFLPFQNRNDRRLQGMYGEAVCRIMNAAYGQFVSRPRQSSGKARRVRLGIVSAHVRRHSIWRVMLKGWLTGIDPDRFDVRVFAPTKTEDAHTETARSACSRFVSGQRSTAEWCSIIRQDDLDILLYPEIGVDAQTLQLAALRLAPVQCASWGHSTTSGLPTMDYFLSGDLVEPDDADDHYTEELIRLPGFSFHYVPEDIPAEPLPREHYGMRPGATVFFCAQALWKYLPEHDDLYPRIARRLQSSHDCQFVFMQHKKLARVTAQFRRRLARAFDENGVDFDRHVLFLPPLSHGAYQRLGQLVDLMLDSIGYGGWTTLLDSLSHDLPIITSPGRFMRGRFAAGALQRMGANELIATDTDEYVEIAAGIAADAERRALLSDRIAQNKARVYADPGCITGLEDFLAARVGSRVG